MAGRGGRDGKATKRRSTGRRPAPARPRSWVQGTLVSIAVALVLSGAIVLAGLWREAVGTVERRLAGEVWTEPGRVLSAPVEVWPGLACTASELAADLRAAGYDPVSEVREPGDVRIADQAVSARIPAARGPGWTVPAADVLVTFRDGRVRSVTPSSPARFAPAVLATVAGAGERRREVPLAEIPPLLRKAVLAVEDADFYAHRGISARGLARALWVDLTAGRPVQGGSTITQQLAKNLFLDSRRTVARKFREALLAVALERRLSKDEILTLYLNGVYLGQAGGQAVHGVAEAARVYFGTSPDALTPGQCATLAGIIAAPGAWSPLRHPERALDRRNVALRRLVETGALDEATARREAALPLGVMPTGVHREADWGVARAVEEAEATAGDGAVAGHALVVHTTLSPPLQRLAERAVAEGLAEVEAAAPEVRGVQAALVAIDARTGGVLALVGGRDYASSTFDRAVAGQRQVGSLVKPLTLVAALDADPALTLATLLADEPYERAVAGETWRPLNHDGRFRGEVTVREAIVHSINVPSIHLAERLGFESLQAFCRRSGLAGATRHPSVALGAFEATPLEVAGAYTVFPGGGRMVRPVLVRAVETPGDPVPEPAHPERTRLVSVESAATAVQALRDVLVSGTGARAARYGVTGAVGGKTGTTDGARDAWFAGFSPRIVAVVWVGFDRGRPVGLGGSAAALPIWARFMAGTGTLTGAFPGEDHPLPRAAGAAGAVEPAPADEAAGADDGGVPVEEEGRMGIIRRLRERLRR